MYLLHVDGDLGFGQFDHIGQIIKLSVVTYSSFRCDNNSGITIYSFQITSNTLVAIVPLILQLTNVL
jgi:hypothetical protein